MRNILIILITCIANFGASASNISSTKITRVLVGPGYGNNVILTVSPLPSDAPSCQTNTGYSYVFDGTTESGKMTLSSVLIAYSTQSNVWLGGTGTCTLYGGIENLKHIVVK